MLKMSSPLFSLLVILLASGWSHAQEPTGNSSHGEAVYQKHCLRCHGTSGKGDGPDAPSLIVRPANFHSPESRSKSDSELRSAIIWGFAFSPMHGWWDRLSKEEMRDVISYIRRLAPFQPESR